MGDATCGSPDRPVTLSPRVLGTCRQEAEGCWTAPLYGPAGGHSGGAALQRKCAYEMGVSIQSTCDMAPPPSQVASLPRPFWPEDPDLCCVHLGWPCAFRPQPCPASSQFCAGHACSLQGKPGHGCRSPSSVLLLQAFGGAALGHPSDLSERGHPPTRITRVAGRGTCRKPSPCCPLGGRLRSISGMDRAGKPTTRLAAKCCPSSPGRFAGKRKNDCKYELTSALSLETESW